jgi:hypothetical protein
VENPQLAAGCGDLVDDGPEELEEDESLEGVVDVEAPDEEESLADEPLEDESPEDEAPDVSLARLSVR